MMDADGALQIDFEKISDFNSGAKWKSNITPGEHIITFSQDEYVWEESVICKSGQQIIVRTKLQDLITAAIEKERAEIRALEERKQAEIREKEERRQAEIRAEEQREQAEIRAAEQQKLLAKSAGSFTDSRDGKVYKTIKIGSKTWMAENLNYTIRGDFSYENASDSEKFGRLYTWDAARKACPVGWHLPSDSEWNDLINNFGGDYVAGPKLKEGGGSGFNLKLGGYHNHNNGVENVNLYGFYWSSTIGEYGMPLDRTFVGFTAVVRNSYLKSVGQSVRCVKD